MGFSWAGASYVEVTAADDGLSHRVTQAVYESCLSAKDGRYLAVCGRVVPAAAMITQPGPICQLCAASVRLGCGFRADDLEPR